MVGCLFLRVPHGKVSISCGDGLAFYEGTWTQKGTIVKIYYRKTSADILSIGETLPGPLKSTTILLKDRLFKFEGNTYQRATTLSKESVEKFLCCSL